MREINVRMIEEKVRNLAIEANYYLPEEIKESIMIAKSKETYPIARDILEKVEENYRVSEDENKPLCQDTGIACIFVEVGQDVHLVGGNLEDSINNGVRRGYKDGYLRKSIVSDPIERVNSDDNTPAVITYKIVDGDRVKIIFTPKGFGSENMSALKMLKPSEGIEGVKKFVIDTVIKAGGNPCPPIVVGVGIGGNFDKVAYLAKKAVVREINKRNEIEFYSKLESDLLEEINEIGIGPQGFGGKTTALAVNVEIFPTHIAGLPVAVNINCHSTRHKEVII